jgi:hypothetical protein
LLSALMNGTVACLANSKMSSCPHDRLVAMWGSWNDSRLWPSLSWICWHRVECQRVQGTRCGHPGG